MAASDDKTLGPCPICGRPMIDGASVDRHHWIPKKEGGAEWSHLHRICHKKLHSLFSEKELAASFSTPKALQEQPDIRTFVSWVRKQPAEYVGRHNRPKRRS
ncbi:MAG: HNH endonuclease [Alphaproteobacteria bacterium]